MNTSTNTTRKGISPEMKKKLIKFVAVPTLALTAVGGVGYAAWTASQSVTADVSVADAPSEHIEYSIDNGETWLPIGDGTLDLGFDLTKRYDGSDDETREAMTPGDVANISIMFRNTSTTQTFYPSQTVPSSVTGTGTMFEGSTPATLVINTPTVLAPEQSMGGGVQVMLPAEMLTTYSGATGVISADFNFTTEAYEVPSGNG